MTLSQVEKLRETLKPCPFCGGGATFEHLENGRWSIGCADIDGDCMGFQSLQTFARKADAEAAWNNRTQPPTDKMREALEDYRRFAGEVAGKCLGLAMSTDHPAPDEVLMGIFQDSQAIAAKWRAALTNGGSHD